MHIIFRFTKLNIAVAACHSSERIEMGTPAGLTGTDLQLRSSKSRSVMKLFSNFTMQPEDPLGQPFTGTHAAAWPKSKRPAAANTDDLFRSTEMK